ncbi:unnamed protein product [Closterium sp. NIES-64]|nr:unnamed protein product [Closterium sp. NIES-64]
MPRSEFLDECIESGNVLPVKEVDKQLPQGASEGGGRGNFGQPSASARWSSASGRRSAASTRRPSASARGVRGAALTVDVGAQVVDGAALIVGVGAQVVDSAVLGRPPEDQLPFWTADSFSFPYITPATPLLTRGSTRKRFFAADLSVAADVASSSGQSDDPPPGAIYFPRPTESPTCMARSFTFTYGFSLNGGGEVGEMGGRKERRASEPRALPSPVALSSWTFRFTGRGEGKWARWGVGKREGLVSHVPCLPPSPSPPGPSDSQGGGEVGEMGGRKERRASEPRALPSPVALSSWTFRFTDTDPCKGSPVLPCGMGACTKARAPWDPSILVPSCKCPLKLPSFQPSHLSGLPSCFPGETWSVVGKRWSAVGTRWGAVGKRWSAVGIWINDSFTCRQFPRNPCAPGVCIDDVDGTYSCLCPSPFFPFYFYPKGAARCYQLRLAETRMPTFLSPYGLTCALILNTYGLTQADFFAQNKGFQCRAPIPVDTLVNITSRAFSQCTSMYTANYYDSSPNALLSLSLPLTHLFPCRSLTSFPAAHSPLSLPLTHLFHLSPCHSLISFPATHSPLSLPLTHLFPRDSLTSFPATHSPLSPRLTHLFPRDSLTSFPATHSPLSPRLTHLFPRDSLTSFPATYSPLSPQLTHLFPRDSLTSFPATHSPLYLHRNGSVFTHSYSLSLPTPPFSSISSFSSPLPPSPRFLHTFISPLSPIFLLSLSPPSPPFASLSPFLLPLPLSPPSLPFSPLSPLSPSLPFSSLPPSQLLCVAFNQTPAELPAAVAGIWRRLSLALLPDESGPLVRCTAAVQPPAGQYDDKDLCGQC